MHCWSFQVLRIALTQSLFNWSNIQQYRQGKLATAASEAAFAQAEQDLIVRVAQVYFDVLAAQDTLAFLEAQKEAIIRDAHAHVVTLSVAVAQKMLRQQLQDDKAQRELAERMLKEVNEL